MLPTLDKHVVASVIPKQLSVQYHDQNVFPEGVILRIRQLDYLYYRCEEVMHGLYLRCQRTDLKLMADLIV